MGLRFGDLDPSAIYIGAQAASKVYVGTEQVWPAVGGGGSAYEAAVLADSPVGYWRLGDTSGTTVLAKVGGNGTYVGGPTLGSTGAIVGDANTAVTFDGANDHAVIDSPAPVTNGAVGVAWSLEVWYRHLGDTGSDVIFGESSLAGARPLAIFQINSPSAGRLKFAFATDTTSAVDIVDPDATTWRDGNWHHLVATHAVTNPDGNILYYRDGVLRASAPRISGAVTANARTIGALRRNTLGNFVNGVIDEAAVYNYQLSAARVLAHYNAGIGA